ncbi:MAG: MOSC domain-containing protein [Pseudomonadota bacterium]
MPDTFRTRPHRTAAELAEALPDILGAPKDEGRLDLIVSRPGHGQRTALNTAAVSLAGGLQGDHWSKGCWRTTEAGDPHPDVQICMMMSRCIAAIAGDMENWPPAGDNFFIDMDLTPANMPPGTRFSIGTAEFVVTEEIHAGCDAFIERYGRDACVFVNTGPGKTHKLRGIYARVTKDGEIARGNVLRKLS